MQRHGKHTRVCLLKRRACPYLSVGNGTALRAHRGPDLAALRSGVEILGGHVDGESLHSALDPNLNTVEIDEINPKIITERGECTKDTDLPV